MIKKKQINIFNKNTVTVDKRFNPDGEEYFDSLYALSDYISVDANSIYTSNKIFTNLYCRMFFYNSSKTKIGRNDGGDLNSFTTPANTAFVRFGVAKTNLDTFILVKGDNPTGELKSIKRKVNGSMVDIKKIMKKVNGSMVKIFGSTSTKLPEEYQELEYIESNGTQYIDTLISPTDNFTFEQEIKFTRIGTGGTFQTSGRYETSNRAFQIGVDGTGYIKANIYGTQYTSSNVATVDTKYIFKGVVNNGNSNIYVNNESVANGTYTYNSIDTSLYLFNRNSSIVDYKRGSAEYIQLYSCKMYDNNTLVRDFVPCYRKADDVVGLYDIVNNVFYINGNSTAFIKGPEV